MSKLVVVLAALLVGGCATTAGQDYSHVYDRKYNAHYQVANPADSEFVGAAAAEPKRPTWWMRGHP